jgi:hypothetical protein
MTKKTQIWQFCAAIAVGVALGVPIASADPHHDHGDDHHPPHGAWHGNDMHHFHDHDEVVWRGGRWFHGNHSGRGGWWWIVGGDWYFYPAPIYPYPDPLVPAAAPPAPVAAPGVNYWYYCQNPAGYYPYVPACPAPWVPVPASN